METRRHTVALSSVLRRLLCDHRIFCSADCCKAGAFQLSEGSMARWLTSERGDRSRDIAAEVERIEADIRDVDGCIFLAASGLESEWDANEFRAFWGRLIAVYTAAAEDLKRLQ